MMGAADFVPKNGINGINGITMVFVIVALQLCMGVWLVVPKGVASEKGQNHANSHNSKQSGHNEQKPTVKSLVPLILF